MVKNAFCEKLKNSFVIFDGGMGTELQARGLMAGEAPEVFLMKNAEKVKNVHLCYKEAGADVLTSCTFGANRLKLADTGYSVEEVIKKAIETAKSAAGDSVFVGHDIGPIGEMIEPVGTLTREEAYDIFKEQVVSGEKYGADFIIIETMTDLTEAKLALLAAKENTSLPVVCTMSFEESGRTFTGCLPSAMALTLSPLADAIGINCSLGPAEILPIAKTLLEYTDLPVVVQPNAGLPHSEGDKAVYDVLPEEFATVMKELALIGVNGLGGCCGTTPEYIKNVRKVIDFAPVQREKATISAVCTPSRVVNADDIYVIGERINPTGKKRFKEALKNHDIDYIISQGIEQADAGADVLDVNVGLPEIDEVKISAEVITRLQAVLDLPLQIDSTNPSVIEKALRTYTGRAIVNSVNGETKVLDNVLPLVKKYGAMVVALTLDENGIPKSVEERIEIAKRIIKRASEYGIARENIIVDCLTLTVSAQQEDAVKTLKAVRYVTEKLGVKTVLGVSNISFGLPCRAIINETFLAQAFANGLTMAIINPNAEGMMRVVNAHRVLSGKDVGAAEYIEKYASEEGDKTTAKAGTELSLADIITKGIKSSAGDAARALLTKCDAMTIVNEYIIPSLDAVGEKFEKGKIFLPQLVNSAETVKEAFEVIKESLAVGGENINRGTIILATVKGDIHDIGKNIVKVILENYGYKIVDLGKNVSPEEVVASAKEHGAHLVGLSALMTTTVKSMQETIEKLREEVSATKVMVGGAVLTPEYANEIGADFYARDAKEAAEIAKKFFAD